jgi:hypothetical protein
MQKIHETKQDINHIIHVLLKAHVSTSQKKDPVFNSKMIQSEQ